jgi:hypothetical protein
MRVKDQAMRTRTSTLLAAIAALGLVVAPAAHAQPRHWRGHGPVYRRGPGPGPAVAGALVGLGVGALVGGAIVASQQPYYAPPPVPYAPAPAYYPPPAYGPPPGY